MILIDSVYIKIKSIILKCFFENINILLEKKMSYFITDDIEIYFDDSDDPDDCNKKLR